MTTADSQLKKYGQNVSSRRTASKQQASRPPAAMPGRATPGSPSKSPQRCENLAEPPDRAEHLLLRQAGPLAAHDEVIDPEHLAVSCDLLLYRGLVADDEAVAGEILEGCRGALLQPPG